MESSVILFFALNQQAGAQSRRHHTTRTLDLLTWLILTVGNIFATEPPIRKKSISSHAPTAAKWPVALPQAHIRVDTNLVLVQ
jgi:hypothetical protein